MLPTNLEEKLTKGAEFRIVSIWWKFVHDLLPGYAIHKGEKVAVDSWEVPSQVGETSRPPKNMYTLFINFPSACRGMFNSLCGIDIKKISHSLSELGRCTLMYFNDIFIFPRVL